jgi:tetratricopeptide (TPR) repeat protein
MLEYLILPLVILLIWSVVIWLITAPAFVKRLEDARRNNRNPTQEIVNFIFSPLTFFISILEAAVIWLFRLLARPLGILLFPFLVLGILIAFYPRVLELILKKLGFYGEEILKYNEQLPQRTVKESQAGWASFWGSFALLFSRSPFKFLLSDTKSIRLFQMLGLQDKALSVLRAQAMDPNQDMEIRKSAVETLALQNQVDDLLNITRARDIQPDVARKVVECLEKANKLPEAIQAWNLLCTHNSPEMQLEAAQSLLRLNQSRRASIVILRLARDAEIDEMVRIRAAEILGRQGNLDNAEPVLLQMMGQGQTEAVRLSAAEALWRLNQSEAALAVIYRCLDTNLSFDIRKQAIQTLGKLQLKRDLLLVKTNPYLTPNDWREAAYALENCGETCAAFLSWVSLARSSKVPEALRSEALQAAARLGENRIQRIQRKSQNRIRDYLTAIGRQVANPAVLRLQAGKTLEKLGFSNEASDLYLSLANPKNPDQSVRRQAEKALKQLKIRLQAVAAV